MAMLTSKWPKLIRVLLPVTKRVFKHLHAYIQIAIELHQEAVHFSATHAIITKEQSASI